LCILSMQRNASEDMDTCSKFSKLIVVVLRLFNSSTPHAHILSVCTETAYCFWLLLQRIDRFFATKKLGKECKLYSSSWYHVNRVLILFAGLTANKRLGQAQSAHATGCFLCKCTD
jgi:hypothetical protein